MAFSIVVVGAGPAGSTTSYELARQGVRVLLLEEHAEAGVPVHCAGLVTPRTLEMLRCSRTLVLNQIKGCCVHSPIGKVLTLGGDKVRALVIDRMRLDQAMAEQAQEAGAVLQLGTRVHGLERVNGHVRLRLDQQGRQSYLDTRLVIGADGSRSVIARSIRAVGWSDAVTLMAAEVKTRRLNQEFVHVFLGDDVAPGWFAWLIPVDSYHARIGVGTTQPKRDLRKLFRTFLSTRSLLRGARIQRVNGGLIPLTRRGFSTDNVLLVGDAAGQTKPTSGGGVYTGVNAAALCAQTAWRALYRDDFSQGTLARYERDWDALLGPEIALGRQVRRLFVSLRPREIDALMDAFQRREFQRLISRHGDIDLQARLFPRFLTLGLLLDGLPRLPVSLWPKVVRLALRWNLYRLARGLHRTLSRWPRRA